MSLRTEALQEALTNLELRIKMADNAHQAARATLARFEGPVTHPMYDKVRREVDSTLVHLRIMQAVWHRTKADLLEQLNIDKE